MVGRCRRSRQRNGMQLAYFRGAGDLISVFTSRASGRLRPMISIGSPRPHIASTMLLTRASSISRASSRRSFALTLCLPVRRARDSRLLVSVASTIPAMAWCCVPLEIAVAARPRVLIIENVPAALSGGHSRIWAEAEALLRSQRYNVRRYVAEGTESGVPQRRRRLFLICWLGSDCIRVAPDPVANPGLLEALSGLEYNIDHDPVMLPAGSRDGIIAEAIPPGSRLSNVRISDVAVPTWSIPAIFGQTTPSQREVLVAIVRLRRRGRRRSFGDADPVLPSQVARYLARPIDADIAALIRTGYLRSLAPFIDITHTYNGKFRRLDWRAPAPTVDTHFGDPRLFLHPKENRGLTPREAARIQGFPDAFKFLGGRRERFELIGNAVPPPMAARIAAFVRRALL